MASTFPALPTDSNYAGANVSPGPPPPNGGMAGGSPFSGGLPGMMQAVQQIEAGYQTLVSMLPSTAPLAAEAISKLRIAIPNAIGAMAQPPGAPPAEGGAQGLPMPPMGGM